MRRRNPRLVQKDDLSEVFIECPQLKWQETYEAWMEDHSRPCPMPWGHKMFDHPKQYDVHHIKKIEGGAA